MSIDQSNTIDFLTINEAERACYAIIADHREWDDWQHLKALQKKINNYLAFIESGEIYTHKPEAKGKDIVIVIRCKYMPVEPDDLHFLQNVKTTIQNAGFQFKVITDNSELELVAIGN